MGAAGLPRPGRITAIASLGDRNRRALYDYVRNAGAPVGRDEAAESMGMPRSTASFHLDRLVQDGILRVEFRKAAGKGGPGSGRPAKFYVPALEEVAASVPERSYDLAADLMASAIAASSTGVVPAKEALLATARSKGCGFGRPGDLHGTLIELGYMPEGDSAGGYRLLNCPFHRLSVEHRDVICPMNGAFLQGAAVSSGVPESAVVSDEPPGHCCARIVVGDPGRET
ncbi:helix-turn-helix domain-containing protein [Paenarthrobacter sp. S56]|uniref:helix-turn-helix transcriptional regulator n=1 Tax=Paenarthrobacter sp. S56 TaxID=3138179 RepID=UPI00321C36F2